MSFSLVPIHQKQEKYSRYLVIWIIVAIKYVILSISKRILQSPEKNTHESTLRFRHIGMTLSCKLVSCKHCFFLFYQRVFFMLHISNMDFPQPQGLDFFGSNIDTHLLCEPIENRFIKIQIGILVSSLIASNPLKNQFHIFLIEVERVVSLKANLTSDGTT